MTEEVYSKIVEESPIGYCLITENLQLEYINKQLLDFLSLTQEQLSGGKWIQFLIEKNYLGNKEKAIRRWLNTKFSLRAGLVENKFIVRIIEDSRIEYCVQINCIENSRLRLVTVYPVSGTILLHHSRVSRTLSLEYKIASKIQRNINDFIIDMIEGRFFKYHFKRLFLPSGLLSGDLVNIKTVSRRYSSIFLGDGRGHGIPAALFSALIHSYLNITATEVVHGITDTAQLINNVNQYAFRDFSGTGEFYFFSGVYGLIDGNTRNFSITNAGHPFPVFIRDNKVTRLESNGPIIGINAGSNYNNVNIELKDGDTFIFFTDGLYDIINGDIGSSHDGLSAIFESYISENKSSNGNIFNFLEQRVKNFTSRMDLPDDVTILEMKVEEKTS